MKYLIFAINEPEINVNYQKSPEINVNYLSRLDSSTGGGSGDTSRLFTFSNGDLDVNGNRTFHHNLGTEYVDISVFNQNGLEIVPDSVIYQLNSVIVNLKGFQPLTSFWRCLIEI